MTRRDTRAGQDRVSPELEEFIQSAPPGTYDLFSDYIESPEEQRLIAQAERRSRERQVQRRSTERA